MYKIIHSTSDTAVQEAPQEEPPGGTLKEQYTAEPYLTPGTLVVDYAAKPCWQPNNVLDVQCVAGENWILVKPKSKK